LTAAGTRTFDLWGVPYDGAATLGWPGSRYAPERVRQALGWMAMRVQEGRIYSSDTRSLHAFDEGLLRDRGDAEVVAHDLMATLDACAAAVADSVHQGRLPLVIGGDDSLLYGCLRGFHNAYEGRSASCTSMPILTCWTRAAPWVGTASPAGCVERWSCRA